MRIALFGLGYVGSVTAACLAQQGHQVVALDPVQEKRELIRAGLAPVIESGLDEMVAAAVAGGRLRTSECAVDAVRGADVVLICVGTPSNANGSLDLRHVERVCGEIAQGLREHPAYPVVVVRSTMLPGSLDNVIVPLLERVSGGAAGTDFGVAVCPEFLRESTAISDFHNPPFTVVGTDDERAAVVLGRLFGSLNAPLHVVPPQTAEAIKYTCNAFHALKVTFANEIARFCSAQAVDPRDVMQILCEDESLNISSKYLRPGFAFGGSCLPKDLRALVHRAKTLDQELPLLQSLLPSNSIHIQQAQRLVLETGARRVAFLGLSFKPGTDDLRESPFVSVAEHLLGKGLELRIFDSSLDVAATVGSNRAYIEQRLPHLNRMLCGTAEDALMGAECVVLATTEPRIVAAVLAVPAVPVVDLSGGLDHAIEQELATRQRLDLADGGEASIPAFQGVAW